MADWTDGLKTLDLDTIKPLFDPLEGCEVDAARKLSGDYSFRQTSTTG